MDRNELATQMAEKMKGQGMSFMTEVAMPGCRQDSVQDADIEEYQDDMKKDQ